MKIDTAIPRRENKIASNGLTGRTAFSNDMFVILGINVDLGEIHFCHQLLGLFLKDFSSLIGIGRWSLDFNHVACVQELDVDLYKKSNMVSITFCIGF